MQDEEDFDYYWFEHLYAWNRILDKAGCIDSGGAGYYFMDTETKRLRTYSALLMLADNRWATAEEIEEAAEVGDGNMESILIGLSYLREVEVEMFDDDELCFQLTEFGKSWGSMFLFEHECKMKQKG